MSRENGVFCLQNEAIETYRKVKHSDKREKQNGRKWKGGRKMAAVKDS